MGWDELEVVDESKFDRLTDDDGSEEDSECFDGVDDVLSAMLTGFLIEARGTPHNPHMLDAAGLRPGGLR